jgi:hypothetical protein
VKVFVGTNPWRSEKLLHLAFRAIFGKRYSWRNANLPTRESNFKGCDPFGYAGLPGIDLLPTTHKAYHSAPVWMSIHHADKEFWL